MIRYALVAGLVLLAACSKPTAPEREKPPEPKAQARAAASVPGPGPATGPDRTTRDMHAGTRVAS